jgi:hypothetical protein
MTTTYTVSINGATYAQSINPQDNNPTIFVSGGISSSGGGSVAGNLFSYYGALAQGWKQAGSTGLKLAITNIFISLALCVNSSTNFAFQPGFTPLDLSSIKGGWDPPPAFNWNDDVKFSGQTVPQITAGSFTVIQ